NKQISILIPNQKNSKTKTINLATLNSFQDPILALQKSDEMIEEIVH
ncbi:40080_t:CDS:1, partial [Gigaspora margarita]